MGWSKPSDLRVSMAWVRVRPRDKVNHSPVWRCHWRSKRLRLIQSSRAKRGVKLFAEILREAGAVARDEAILGAVPLAEDIDGIVELCRPERGQEAGPEEPVDQLLAGGGHCRFFCRGETGRSHVVAAHAASVRRGTGFCQFHGRSWSSREAGWSARRRRTSASQACGSTSLSLAVPISV